MAPSTAVPSTTAAPEPTANTVATVTYDGSSCSYDGANELGAGPLEVTYVNDSDEDVGLHIARLFDDTEYDQYQADMEALINVDPISDTILWLNRGFEGFENRGELSETVVAAPGRLALTCVKFEGDGPPVAWIYAPVVPVTENA